MNSMMKIKRVFLAENAAKSRRANSLIERVKPGEVIEVRDVLEANRFLENFPDPWLAGKESLFLSRFPGRFLEPCPCTKEYFRCGYWIISPVVGCPIDCSYCILQGYLTAYPIQIYLNLEDLFQEAGEFARSHKSGIRVGTGELADSLMLEPELGYAKKLIEFFRDQKKCIFELKTKSDRIEIFDSPKPSENIVAAWSVNPERAAALEEKGAAPTRRRLKAAAKLARAGWQVAFHFDPVIEPAHKEPYLALVDEIFQMVPSRKIAWISLGTLRFPLRLKTILKDRHPQSRIFSGEMYPGKDLKLRYLRPVREKFYQALVSRIRGHSSRTLVYLCMESAAMWEKVLGISPGLVRKELALPVSERKFFRPE